MKTRTLAAAVLLLAACVTAGVLTSHGPVDLFGMGAAIQQPSAVGVPLALADISAEAAAELAAQGLNTVVPCSASGTEVNELLAIANGSEGITCGAYDPDAPAVSSTPASSSSEAIAADLTEAGHAGAVACSGQAGSLADLVAATGGEAWACGSENQ